MIKTTKTAPTTCATNPTNELLIQKYNVAAPRYTSYPTVPHWQKEKPALADWIHHMKIAFEENNEISLYIHLPFCENLCTYCGCNKRITKNHAFELPYIEALLREWQFYLDKLPKRPVIRALHLGGGTPTFFSAGNLHHLLYSILDSAIVPENHEFSIEVHPNTTTLLQLQVLRDLGFRRVSIGVQDFSPMVLKAIHRKQTYEQVENVTLAARQMGYESINYDLIYGLPKQTMQDIDNTLTYLETLRPDRIAFYSYAHVPWKSKSQRGYSREDLPKGREKLAMYERGCQGLKTLGYHEIGLDHFALPSDSLYQAKITNQLHRNFMGYIPFQTKLLIGLGMSAISDAGGMFIQNIKTVKGYQQQLHWPTIPFFRGHILNKEDEVLRHHITNLMCQFKTNWHERKHQHPAIIKGIMRMGELLKDELIDIEPYHLEVTKKGEPYIRNICMALDANLWRSRSTSPVFSQVI